MTRIALAILSAAVLLAADNPWAKVQELKSRSELKIYRKGAREPLSATLDEAKEDRILVVVKNEQMSIPKDDIDRLDARFVGKTKGTITKETTATTTQPDFTPHPPHGADVPGESYTTSVSRSVSKPDFETVYRRPPAAPKN